MAARFNPEDFLFTVDETIPGHEDADLTFADFDSTTFSVSGDYVGSDVEYLLATGIDDLATALFLVEARRRLIREIQADSIEDPTFVHVPQHIQLITSRER